MKDWTQCFPGFRSPELISLTDLSPLPPPTCFVPHTPTTTEDNYDELHSASWQIAQPASWSRRRWQVQILHLSSYACRCVKSSFKIFAFFSTEEMCTPVFFVVITCWEHCRNLQAENDWCKRLAGFFFFLSLQIFTRGTFWSYSLCYYTLFYMTGWSCCRAGDVYMLVIFLGQQCMNCFCRVKQRALFLYKNPWFMLPLRVIKINNWQQNKSQCRNWRSCL